VPRAVRRSRRAKRPVGLGLYGREDAVHALWWLTATRLSEEAYQPKQFEKDLSQAEADRRIAALKAEIEHANLF